MSDFDPASTTLRPLSFSIAIVPGTSTVQSASAYYEVVLASGRAIQFSRTLDISAVQDTIDATSQTIIQQLLAAEGLTTLWAPPAPTPGT